MKTSTSVLVMGAVGCLSSALLQAGGSSYAVAADSSTTMSLLQQPSLAAAVTKAQGSGTAPILPNPTALVLTAQKGNTAVGRLTLKKSSTDQHTYYLSTNQSWIWMNPPYGSTQSIATETDQLVITAPTAALPAGTHSAVIYIVESGPNNFRNMLRIPVTLTCLLYTSDAADDLPCVDLGGRRITKKKNQYKPRYTLTVFNTQYATDLHPLPTTR